jgi:hypothetical protein
MKIYIDESGDLGWKLDKPNRHGGSSKFITITGIIISKEEEKYISRFISDIYQKYNLTPNIEKKRELTLYLNTHLTLRLN